MTSSLRSDERASLAESERSKKIDQRTKNVLKTGIGIAGGIGGASIGSRLLPLLNEYIPLDLAIKGISKISPDIGNFLKKGQSMGLDMKEGMNFVKENIAKDSRSIIEQYSPELHKFIEQEIKKGRQPLEAGALAQVNDKFKKSIKQMEKDHKTPFSSILQSIFGGGQQAPQQGQQQSQQSQQMQQPGAQMQQGGQGQQQNADAAIMAALQKVLNM